jgi:hypothetical protein
MGMNPITTDESTMTNQTERSYRKNMAEHGLIYMAGIEHEVIIKNLSLTGLLVELCNDHDPLEISDIYNAIVASPMFDLHLPKLQMAGEVEVVRVDVEESQIFMALSFKHVSHGVNNLLYKIKAYQKMTTAPGKILLAGGFIEFEAVNVSVQGLVIRLNEIVDVKEDTITMFQFKRLDMEVPVKVIWVECSESSTLMGLEYMRMEKTHIEGIPRFSRR